ncbi:MAG: CotH kinase family protein [Nevskiaceae bacterium]
MATRGPGSSAALALFAGGLAAVLAVAPAAAAEAIPIDTLAIEMDARDARVLFRKEPYDKSSFPVTVRPTEEGSARLHGRIEVKGSFTRQTPKKSVLIKLDDGRWRGGSRISLNGMGTDGSMMREWLSWELMRALGMVVPETRYTRLTINGADGGLFLRIAWIDPGMFERAGLGGDGDFFHPYDSAFCGDLTPASLDPARNCYFKLSPRDQDFSALRALAEELVAEPVDTFDQLVDRRFDAESVVNWFAVNALVSATDTYNKNYFLYLSRKTGKWLVVPWDYDLTFGRAFDPDRVFPFTILNDHFQYYFPLEAGQSNPLHYQALKNPKLRARVLARIRDLVTGAPEAARPWRGWFAPERMDARITVLREALLPELRRDPFVGSDEPRWEAEVEALRFYARARVQNLKQVALSLGTGQRRDEGEATVAAGRSADIMDSWGFLLASVTAPAGAPVAVEARVIRGWPELVPPGMDRAACVQRTWFLSAEKPAAADVTLTYLDEGLLAREPGTAVTDERALTLFAKGPSGWSALPTRASPIANTLSTRGLRLPHGEPLRIVACVPQNVLTGASGTGGVAANP